MNKTINKENILSNLIQELDRIPDNISNSELEKNEPLLWFNFVTTPSGYQQHFTQTGINYLNILAQEYYDKNHPTIDIKTLYNIIRQCVANLYVEGAFKNNNVKDNYKLFNQKIEIILQNVNNEFTHSFLAQTLDMAHNEPVVIGPVTIMTRGQWINTIDFDENTKKIFFDNSTNSDEWKKILCNALNYQVKIPREKLPSVVKWLYAPLQTSNSLLRISLSGYEETFSRKLAYYISKTALNGLSLILGHRQFFYQLRIIDERIPPIKTYTLTEENGFLQFPGFNFDKNIIPRISGKQIINYICDKSSQPKIEAIAYILDSIKNTKSTHYPLAMRWSDALNWFAEGNLEANDSIAVAKIATSLDILSCGGKQRCITEMAQNLIINKKDDEVEFETRKSSLSVLVKEIYDYGRSKILHGNYSEYFNPQLFSETRRNATTLAQCILLEAALRLKNYTGEISSKTFRTIPKPSDMI